MRFCLFTKMIFQALILIAFTSTKVTATFNAIQKEGENVVFMFNASASILSVSWGIRDGDTNNFKLVLIAVNTISGVQSTNNAGYAGRVSFVGDLLKGQAWFKITNLNINDTKQYMAQIYSQGGTPGQYNYTFAFLQVMQPDPPTTRLLSTIHTQERTSFPPTSQPNVPIILNNLTTSLKVAGTFSKDMLDNTSQSFTDFASEFKTEIGHAYKDEKKFKSVTVVNLRNGSIHVKFIVFFTSGISLDQACAPLENTIKDGALGSFKVIPGSLECSKPINPSSPSPPSPRTGVHPGIIAGVAVVGVLAIAGLIIAVLFVCRKKSSRKDYRGSTSGQGYEMDARYREPEEQYASVQRPAASGTKHSNDQKLPQYAVVDKSRKTKKNTREPELVYADLDHSASMDARPPSVRRPVSGGDTEYADIQSGRQKQYPPPQYGNILDISHA